MASDFYTYHKQAKDRRRRRYVGVLLFLLALLLAMAGGVLWWYGGGQPASAVQATAEQAAAQSAQATATPAPATPAPQTPESATPESATPESAGSYTPVRLLPQVDNAAWDTAAKVAATLNQDYQNTDHRMVALPMLGTVTDSYFDTVTFVGDSLASGMGIYATGYPNAHYATYRSIGPEAIVNNTTVTNAVTGATETPIETIVASQPDYVYILVGTNTLVNANSEERLLAYYEQMIDVLREKLNPGVVFYIQAIPGVQEDVVQTRPGLDNARIFSVNNLLANLALRKGCYFVNIREALNNLDGSLIDEYDVGLDGVHVNPAGYQAWADYLATHTAWNGRSIYLGQNPWKILGG